MHNTWATRGQHKGLAPLCPVSSIHLLFLLESTECHCRCFLDFSCSIGAWLFQETIEIMLHCTLDLLLIHCSFPVPLLMNAYGHSGKFWVRSHASLEGLFPFFLRMQDLVVVDRKPLHGLGFPLCR